ncbi:hypothetical protein [Nocardia amamiensis]|uniref:hypothetical protein n=1 Tax=Nocardia amamiensis TaxID=404578 RepID=UPI00082C83EE|nr:hypothetical protein [Nocardia amamiensis]
MFDTKVAEALHVIRFRSGVSVEELADLVGVPDDDARALVDGFRKAGYVRSVRGNFIVTADGVAADDAAVHQWRDRAPRADLDLVEEFDRHFLSTNEIVKAAISNWQANRSEELVREVAAQLRSAVVALAFPADGDGDVARLLETYRQRLTKLVERAEGGNPSALSGIRAESFHSVWMELHAELLQLNGRVRTDADGY